MKEKKSENENNQWNNMKSEEMKIMKKKIINQNNE